MSFATRAAAARSTAQFKKEVAVLGGVRRGGQWGWGVVGRKEAGNKEVEKGREGEGAVTMVVGVRKKRKDGDATTADAGVDTPVTLDAGLVRKKVKVESSAPVAPPADAAKGEVKVLGAGLVRKKPKA